MIPTISPCNVTHSVWSRPMLLFPWWKTNQIYGHSGDFHCLWSSIWAFHSLHWHAFRIVARAKRILCWATVQVILNQHLKWIFSRLAHKSASANLDWWSELFWAPPAAWIGTVWYTWSPWNALFHQDFGVRALLGIFHYRFLESVRNGKWRPGIWTLGVPPNSLLKNQFDCDANGPPLANRLTEELERCL